MCLRINSVTKPEPKIATEDIVCYKELRIEDNGTYTSEFQYFIYIKHKLYELGFDIETIDGYELGDNLNWVIHEGFHSWKERPVCYWTVNRGHHRIFKFIIPKGATYYEGIQHDGKPGYVSDKIIMKNCAYYTGFWSFLNSFLVR